MLLNLALIIFFIVIVIAIKWHFGETKQSESALFASSRLMRIDGRLQQYVCRFQSSGWTYAEVSVGVFKQRRISLGRNNADVFKQLWLSSGPMPVKYEWARKANPEQIRTWFKTVVDEYEAYKISWDNEIDGELNEVDPSKKIMLIAQ